MASAATTSKADLIAYLPAIYYETAGEQRERPFLADYLRAYGELLLGADGGTDGFEQIVDRLPQYWRPLQTPETFLPWLGTWVALAILADLPPARFRLLIANAIPLYRIRGTKLYVLEMLRLYLDATASITEDEVPPFQINRHSTVGVDTYLGGGPPYFFRVKLVFRRQAPPEVARQSELARRVVDFAKPAHTYYELDVISPKMQILVHSTVGVDTVLVP